MLILTRRMNEKIIIGNDNEVAISVLGVIEYNGKYSVKIGIEADKSIKVMREELLLRIRNEEDCQE